MLVPSRFRRSGQVIMNTIQTNGTRITDPWARFLRDNQFFVGVSLDGPPEIHNKYRMYESGRPSFQDVSATLDKLREYDIPFSVLMVIDEDALEVGPKRIFDFFVKTKITNFGFLAATPVNSPNAMPYTFASHYVDPKRMTNFLINMYDCWKEHGDTSIRIREIEGILQHIRHNRSHLCTLEGNCFGRYYLVEPNGEIAHCDLFQGDARYTLGNILDGDFKAFRNSKELCALIEENQMELNNMQRHCPEFAVCRGWCPHERYLSVRHNPNHTSKCCGLVDLIRYIRDNMPIRV
jgi:uncharacterized protein